jgi:hypothetical protein
MKLRLFAALAFVLCTSATLFGQDFAGTWQGTLAPPGAPNALRIVFKIRKVRMANSPARLFRSIREDSQSR